MTEQTSLLEAQRHNFSQFTMQDLLDPDQFRAKVRWAMFQPYFEERRLHNRSTQTLPDIKANLSSIGPEKPSRDGKEFYQCFIHFRPEVAPSKDKDSRMVFGNQLLDKLSTWKVMHPNKPLMDVTLTKVEGHVIYEVVNLDLFPQCIKQAVWHYSVNQVIMDILADKLINAWGIYSTNFVLHITLHD